MSTLLKRCWTVLINILLFIAFYVMSKYALRRKRSIRELPAVPLKLADIWEDVKNFPLSLTPKFSKCINTYNLQTLSGYSQLFRNRMVFCSWLMFTPVVWVVKAEAVEELLCKTKNLEKSWFYDWIQPWLNTGLTISHGHKWKSHRKLLLPSFHFELLRDFLPAVNKQSQALVEALRDETQKEWTNVSSIISLCTLCIICETTLGVNFSTKENSKSSYVEAMMRVSSTFMQRISHPLYLFDFLFYMSRAGRQFKKDVKVIQKFTRSVIRHKRSKVLQGRRSSIPGNPLSLMDILLVHHFQDVDLTEEDIREEVDSFTFEGHETMTWAVTWTLYLIGLHQGVQDRIHEELDLIFGNDGERNVTSHDLKSMKYLDRVLKESQRLYPSVPMFSRKSGSGNVINGYEIPEGTAVTVFVYELHRDPSVFPNPEKFDPDRFLPEISKKRHPYAYIPFSAGPRNCIGQRFAVMEEKVIIADILRNYNIETLEARDKVIPVADLILRSAEPLKIRIRHRTL